MMWEKYVQGCIVGVCGTYRVKEQIIKYKVVQI